MTWNAQQNNNEWKRTELLDRKCFFSLVIIDTIRHLIMASTPALAMISGQKRLCGIVALVI